MLCSGHAKVTSTRTCPSTKEVRAHLSNSRHSGMREVLHGSLLILFGVGKGDVRKRLEDIGSSLRIDGKERGREGRISSSSTWATWWDRCCSSGTGPWRWPPWWPRSSPGWWLGGAEPRTRERPTWRVRVGRSRRLSGGYGDQPGASSTGSGSVWTTVSPDTARVRTT